MTATGGKDGKGDGNGFEIVPVDCFADEGHGGPYYRYCGCQRDVYKRQVFYLVFQNAVDALPVLHLLLYLLIWYVPVFIITQQTH